MAGNPDHDQESLSGDDPAGTGLQSVPVDRRSATGPIHRFWGRLPAPLRGRIARRAAGTFTIKIAAVGLSLISSVLLARLLGAEQFGIYFYAFAWIELLSVLAVLGLDLLLVRETAAYETQQDWGHLRGLLRRADQATLGLTLVLILLIWLGPAALSLRSPTVATFQVAFLMLPFMALLRLRQSTMQGLHYVVRGQISEALVQPVVFIGLLVCITLVGKLSLGASGAMGAQVIAAAVALIVGIWLTRGTVPAALKQARALYRTRDWAASAVSLVFVVGVQIFFTQSTMIFLGLLADPLATGLYATASRGAGFIAFVLLAVNTALAPTISSLYAAGDLQRLQRIVTKGARVTFLFSLPITVALVIFGRWFLLLYGPAFTAAQTTLIILSIGQLANAAMGPVGLLLIMTGHQRDAVFSIGVSSAIRVLLCFLLIPTWGIEGAAAAAVISLIVWNISLVMLARYRLGIRTTVLGRLHLRGGDDNSEHEGR